MEHCVEPPSGPTVHSYTVVQHPYPYTSITGRQHIEVPMVLLKIVFHFNNIVAKHSLLYFFMNIQTQLMTWTQKNMLLFATIELKWKTALTVQVIYIQPNE